MTKFYCCTKSKIALMTRWYWNLFPFLMFWKSSTLLSVKQQIKQYSV